MTLNSNFKEIKFNDLEIHPSILNLVTEEHLDLLLQDTMTDRSNFLEVRNPVFVVKKKGSRRKYWLIRGFGTYIAHKRLYENGQEVPLKIVQRFEEFEENRVVQEMFFYEFMATKRTQSANAVINLIYKKFLKSREGDRLPPPVKASVRDLTRSGSLRQKEMTGFDGRAFNNEIQLETPLESLISEIKRFKK